VKAQSGNSQARSLLVLGAGGHGRVVADAAELAGTWRRIDFLDDRYPGERTTGPWNIVGRLDRLEELAGEYHAGVAAFGKADLRLREIDRIVRAGLEVAVVIHPTAVVSRHAQIQAGSVVFANAVVNVGASIGRGCIINTGATVDHDCKLEEGVHICPGVNLAGAVFVGARAWIGIGAAVKQNIAIGAGATLGAGAVCIRDVAPGETVVGVPARRLGAAVDSK
jgi:sugar O-acyltransferase (sialic acid O-acetyltransferase NeuD family)